MEWRQMDILKLIAEYRKHECLWNASATSPPNKLAKINAWKSIARVFRCDWFLVEKKMRGLVGQFQRELRNGRGSENSSSWFAFNDMLFLRHKHKRYKTNSYFQRYPSNTEYTEENENKGLISNPTEESSLNDVVEPNVSIVSGERMVIESPTKIKCEFDNQSVVSPSVDQKDIHDVMTKNTCNCSNRDDSQIYGDYVASKLRKLNDNAQNKAQHAINDILYWAAMGHYDDNLNGETHAFNSVRKDMYESSSSN